MEPVLYDADAEQRIPVQKEFGGELVNITFILGAQIDEALKEYDRLCDRRLESLDSRETGERNAMVSKDRSEDAAKWLFKDRAVGVDGLGDEDAELPANWKELIDDADQVAVIDRGYLATGEVPKPPAKQGKRLPWDYKTAGAEKVISIRAFFNGYELELNHRREAKPSAEQMAEFKALQGGAAIVGGKRLGTTELLFVSKAMRFGALYDSIGYKSEDYKGRVPLHHKRKVVELDLASDAEVITKKQSDSPS